MGSVNFRNGSFELGGQVENERIVRVLIEEHDKLSAYSWLILRDAHLVEEVLQEVGMLAIRKHDEINDEAHLRGWARTACRNLAMNLIRKENRRPIPLSESVLDLVDERWRRYDRSGPSELFDSLQECLNELSPYSRKLVDLRYGEGLRSAQMAERLDRKVNTIYVALTRIHRRLGDCIERKLKPE